MQSSIFSRLLKQATENFVSPNLELEKTQGGNALLDKLYVAASKDLEKQSNTTTSVSIFKDELPKPVKDARLHQILKVVKDFKGLHTLNINEENTINALIAPILTILGWDRSDLTSVKSEWRKTYPNGRVDTKRCDFALFASSRDPRPIALVEAKAVRERLDDTHVDQVMSYAFSANVRWAILTNGLEWRLYDTFQTGMFSKNSLVFRENVECVLEYEPCHLLRITKDAILQLDELVYSKIEHKVNQDRMSAETESLKQLELKELDRFGEAEYLKLADRMRPISLESFVECLVNLDRAEDLKNPIWRHTVNKESLYRDLFHTQRNPDRSVQVSIPYLSKNAAENLFSQIKELSKLDEQGLGYYLQNTRLLIYFNQATPSLVFQEFGKVLEKHESEALKRLNGSAKASSFLYDFDFNFELHPLIISSKLSSVDSNGVDVESPMFLYFNDVFDGDDSNSDYQPDHLYFLLWYFYLGLENLLGLRNESNSFSAISLSDYPSVSVQPQTQNAWFFKKFGASLTIAQQIEKALAIHESTVLQQHELLGTNAFKPMVTHSSVSSILCACCDNQFFDFFRSELSKHTGLLPYVDKTILKKVATQVRKRKNRLAPKM